MSRKSKSTTRLALGVSIFAISGAFLWAAGSEEVHAGSLKADKTMARAGISKVSGLKRSTTVIPRVRTGLAGPKGSPGPNSMARRLNHVQTARSLTIAPTATANKALAIGRTDHGLQTRNQNMRQREFGRFVNNLPNRTIAAARNSNALPRTFWRLADANTALTSVKTWTMKSVPPMKKTGAGYLSDELENAVTTAPRNKPNFPALKRDATTNARSVQDGAGKAPALHYELTNAMITSYQVSGSGNDTRPIGRHHVAALLNAASPDVSYAEGGLDYQFTMNYQRISDQGTVSPRFDARRNSGSVKIEGKSRARHLDTTAGQQSALLEVSLGGADTSEASADNEGGSRTPFFANYRPQFYFRTIDTTGSARGADHVAIPDMEASGKAALNQALTIRPVNLTSQIKAARKNPAGGTSSVPILANSGALEFSNVFPDVADRAIINDVTIRPATQLDKDASQLGLGTDASDATGRAVIHRPKVRILDEPILSSGGACYPEDGVCEPPGPGPLNCSNQSHPDC